MAESNTVVHVEFARSPLCLGIMMKDHIGQHSGAYLRMSAVTCQLMKIPFFQLV